MTRDQRGECRIDEAGVHNPGKRASSAREELCVNRRAHPCASHAISMPLGLECDLAAGRLSGRRSSVLVPMDLETLAAAASEAPAARRLRDFVEWVDDGRPLTQTGRLRRADALELVELLDTGDRLDFPVRSSAELYRLSLVLELAKAFASFASCAGDSYP